MAYGVFYAFGDGTTWPAVATASELLWSINALVLSGARNSTRVNNVLTVIKVIPITLLVVLAVTLFDLETFMGDFYGKRTAASFSSRATPYCWRPCGR